MGRYYKKIRKYLPQTALFVSLLWLFVQIAPIIFATHDDLRNYLLVRSGGMAAEAVRLAKDGRISQLWDQFLLGVPFLANRIWFYKLVQYAAFLFDLFAGWLLLKTHTERRFADLAAVLMVSWACISNQNNLLISYAFGHQLALGFALLSLYHFGNRLKRRAPQETVKCCIFLLLSVMIYEAFAALLLVMLLWALCRSSKKRIAAPVRLRRAVKRILPQLCTVGVYCLIYFAWQRRYPSGYDGIQLELRHPFQSLAAVLGYSFGNFPLQALLMMKMTREMPLGLSDILRALHPAAWLSAVLAAAVFTTTLPQIRLRTDAQRRLLLISGIGTLVPCMLIACTEKYLSLFRGGVGTYVPSFYSFVFLTAFLAALGLRFYRAVRAQYRRTVRVVLTVCVFCISLTASAVNALWKPHFAALLLRYRNFDYAVSATLPALDGTWQLYTPDNPGIHKMQEYSEDYLKLYNPAEIAYIHTADALSAEARTFCIRMPEDYTFAVTGAADAGLRAQTLTFRTVTPEKFNILLYDTDGEALFYENVQNGNILALPEGKWFDLTVRVAAAEYTP